MANFNYHHNEWRHTPDNIFLNFVIASPFLEPFEVFSQIKNYPALSQVTTDNFFVKIATTPVNVNGTDIEILNVSGPITDEEGLGFHLRPENLNVTHNISFKNLSQVNQAGNYTTEIVFEVYKQDFEGVVSLIETSIVTINVLTETLPSLSVQELFGAFPKSLIFSHIINSPLPPAKQFDAGSSTGVSYVVLTPLHFTVSGYQGSTVIADGQVIVSPSIVADSNKFIGNGPQDIQVSLNSLANSMPVGVISHRDIYIIHKGFYDNNVITEETVKRHLQVTQYYFENNDAIINHGNLNFKSYKNVQEADFQYLSILAPGPITITYPNWLTLNKTSANINLLTKVIPVPSNTIEEGLYVGDIVITANGVQYNILVTYEVLSTAQINLNQENINFTDDYETISTFFSNSNYRLILKLIITYYNYGEIGAKSILLPYRLGFFNNQVEFFIGKTVNNVMPELLSPSSIKDLENFIDYQPKFYFYYQPTTVNVNTEFFNTITQETTEVLAYNDFKFIKGRKPKVILPGTVILSFYADPLRVTNNSKLIFNFYKNQNHSLRIYVNEIFDQEILQTVNNQGLYALPIFFANYKTGDTVEIRLYKSEDEPISESWYDNTENYISQKYIVFPEGKQSTHIGWESEYGCLDVFEFTGASNFETAYKANIINNFKKFKEKFKKIDSERLQFFTINTGPILKTNHNYLDGLLNSSIAWIFQEGKPAIELIPEDISITNSDSEKGIYEFDVKFKINFDNDYKINS